MMKKYQRAPDDPVYATVQLVATAPACQGESVKSYLLDLECEDCSWLGNAEAESTLHTKLSHLT